jgi:DNA adenine methylase
MLRGRISAELARLESEVRAAKRFNLEGEREEYKKLLQCCYDAGMTTWESRPDEWLARRLAPWILSFIPEHESYLEPYFGGGGVFFNKPKSRIETINDIDGEVVHFFKICRNRPAEIADALYFTPWAREEREAAYDPTDDEIERARRFAVRCWMTFGASVSKTNGWRHTTAKNSDGGPDNPKLWARMPQSVRDASARLLEAQIENRPALEVIRRCNGPRVLIYADPPYVQDTRTAHCRSYGHEMTDADHEELLRALAEHTGMVVLSGYDCDLYNDSLRDWRKETTSTTAELAAKRVECLWINPASTERLRQTKGSCAQLTLDDLTDHVVVDPMWVRAQKCS